MASKKQEAFANKPKKPLNAYFKLRMEKYKEYGEGDDKKEKFKQFWDSIPDKKKDEYKDEFNVDLENWRNEIKKWQNKYGITD